MKRFKFTGTFEGVVSQSSKVNTCNERVVWEGQDLGECFGTGIVKGKVGVLHTCKLNLAKWCTRA
eukprot:1031266-Amphidinium_carterae.1